MSYLLFTEWLAGFPPPLISPNTNTLPQEWVNALNSAVAAGAIPNIPLSTVTPGSNPVYPNGTDPTSPGICSGTLKCRIAGDIWDAPEGIFASSFDDGPTQVSSFYLFIFWQDTSPH
jgi:chitin deacetylase